MEIATLASDTANQNVILLHNQDLRDPLMKLSNNSEFSIKFSVTKTFLAFIFLAEHVSHFGMASWLTSSLNIEKKLECKVWETELNLHRHPENVTCHLQIISCSSGTLNISMSLGLYDLINSVIFFSNLLFSLSFSRIRKCPTFQQYPHECPIFKEG